MSKPVQYNEGNIKTIEGLAHIRHVPGMYIGKLGNGKSHDDGIYVLVKEVIDNSIDEFRMNCGKYIEVEITTNPDSTQTVRVKDQGRGIPLGSVVDCVSIINTSGKFDSRAFQKSVGLHGVGTKAVNALSQKFIIQAVREGKTRSAEFALGELQNDSGQKPWKDPNWKSGTQTTFIPDPIKFGEYAYQSEYLERMFQNYACLNPGLTISFTFDDTKKEFFSQKGLQDLLEKRLQEGGENKEICYPLIHLKDPTNPDLEIVLTHSDHSGEELYSFVNGQATTQGGTHEVAFRDGIVKVIREHYAKTYDTSDIRSGIVAAISLRIQSPVFESQTKTKLGSANTEPSLPDGTPQGTPLKTYFASFLKLLDNFLHKNPETDQAFQKKILRNETERKAMAGIKDKAKETEKKARLKIPKLEECKVHLTSTLKSHEETKLKTTIFITEGDSAGGAVAEARNSEYQAVYPLKGKPDNCFGVDRSFIYKQPVFHLLIKALGIEDGLEGLKYNNVVIATDADVDGMHIRMLVGCFFLQYFPELVKAGHVYFLQTPLFRVRDKKEIIYCYNELEKDKAIKKLGGKPEITRFKGLGEIKPKDFKAFIGDKILLEPFLLDSESNVKDVLSFCLGDNTPERKEYLLKNLKYEVALNA
jgi:topoisomerase-4 subunit B